MVTQATSPANSAKRGDLRILWLPAVFCLLLIALEVHFLVNDRYFSRPRVSAQGESIATYVSGRNRVRKKTAGTLVWEAPEGRLPLYREDAIATMEDSEAVIAFADQSELVVEPNSLVILEQAPEAKPGAPAGGAGIVARLVKGSVKRRNSGTSPFFIKLSRDKAAEPVAFEDTGGHSVFRVIYKIEGYQVVVESGAVKVAGKTIAPSTKLKAPKLNKPTIEMVPAPDDAPAAPGGAKGGGAGALHRVWSLFIADARAAEARQIAIHFSWEGIEGASSYRVQVSRDPSFATVLREGEVIGTTFEFLLPAPETKSELFFRVAGVTLEREIGEYSSVEKIEVNPVTPEAPATVKAEQPVRMPVPPPVAVAKKPRPSPSPAATPAPPAREAEPAVAAATPARAEAPVPPPAAAVEAFAPRTPSAPVHVWLAYGALYDQRKIKNDTGNLREASGGGIVPAQLALELRRSEDNHSFWSAGGSHVFEAARPELPAPGNEPIPLGALRAWVTYGKSFGRGSSSLWIWQAGPYVATSKRILNQGLSFSAETRWLAGPVLSLQSDPGLALESGEVAWRFQAALLAIGGFGVDAQAAARKALFRTGEGNGLFGGLELSTRQAAAESAFGAALQLGWWH